MNRRSPLIVGFVLALSYWPFAHGAPPVAAQTEINYLLAFVEQSGCQFYRNGSWYDSKQAQAHLRTKYDALTALNRIATAEDFIEKGATKSSLSGQAYAIRCNGDPGVPTNQWLRDVLARYRSSTRKSASHAPCDALVQSQSPDCSNRFAITRNTIA